LRPAAGWLARRLMERGSDAVTAIAGDRSAVPPRRLRARVGAPGVTDYIEGGRAAALALDAALAPRSFGGFSAVLDFGCGPGRVIDHVADLSDRAPQPLGVEVPGPSGGPPRLVGVDVDAESIAWANAHARGAAFEATSARPPLPFADREFELIYSISVLSHLDPVAQDTWLAELVRILIPGGVALLSTHGPSAYAAFASGEVRTAWCDPQAFRAHESLRSDDILSVPYRQSRWSRGDLPGVEEGYGLTFHGPGYIRAHWSRFLDVEAILPRAISGWQDLVLASRPG
jgi:SAM-dependent methyltransferase